MDALTVRLLIIFLPGFISFFIVRSLTSVKPENNYYALITSLILGFVTYLTLWPFYNLYTYFALLAGHKVHPFNIINAILDSNQNLNTVHVLIGALWAIVLGVLVSLVVQRKYFHRFMQFIGITSKFAEHDVWSFIMNQENRNMEWIYYRDFENDHLYFGNIRAFSSTYMECELLLSNAKVYENSSGEFLYEVPLVYLARDVKKISIEFPSLGDVNGK